MSRKHQRRKNAHISPVVGLPLPRPALRPRRRFLLSSTAIVLAGCLAFNSPAWANEECGAPPSVTCISTTYSTGIIYDTDTSFFTDLTMVIESGALIQDTVHIDTSSGVIDVTIQSGALIQALGGDGAGGLEIYDAASVAVVSYGAFYTYGNNAPGILIENTGGNVAVDHSGTIDTAGTQDSDGILVYNTAGNVVIDASGSISTDAKYSQGIYVGSSNDLTENVTITASGAIVTGLNYLSLPSTSSQSHGIEVDGANGSVDVTLDSAGSIKTYGANAHGIFIDNTGDGIDYDSVTVTAVGAITTKGVFSNGIFIDGTTGDVTVSSADITTNNIFSAGVVVHDTTGAVTVNQSGTIHTEAYASGGISVIDTSGDVVIDASGNIYTDADLSRGIYVTNSTVSGGNVEITASGRIATGRDYQALPTTNSLSHGIYVTNIDGQVDVTLDSSGSIETYGARATGILIDNTGDGSGVDYVNVTANGSITTNGDSSQGIFVADTSGDVTVSAADITTDGLLAHGIYIAGTTGNVTVSVVDIDTYGALSHGVSVLGTTGAVTVNHSGTIHTRDSASSGVGVLNTTGDVDIDVSGNIYTEADYSQGVYVVGASNVGITISGTISTGRDYQALPTTNSLSHGIYVTNIDGQVDVTLDSSGSIETYGANAHGIFIDNTGDGIGYDSVTVTADGGITTNGDSSHGIYIDDTIGDVSVATSDITINGSGSHGIYVRDTAGNVAIDHSGTIGTQGLDSDGMRIYGTDGNVVIGASGDLYTDGVNSQGITVGSSGYTENVDITASGRIATGQSVAASTDSFAHGIEVANANGQVDVTLYGSGSIETYGAEAHGIYVSGTGDGSLADYVTVTANGSIVTNGYYSHGIYIEGTNGDVTVTSGGSITASGNSSAGILLSGTFGNVSVTHTGTITTEENLSSGLRVENTTGDVVIGASGNIYTDGANSQGIYVASASDVTENVDITVSGRIATSRDYKYLPSTDSNAHAVRVAGANGSVDVTLGSSGTIETYGAEAFGIYISNAGNGDGDSVNVTADGAITTNGDASYGIYILDTIGNVTVSATDVTTYGTGSHGIFVRDTTGGVTINHSGAINTLSAQGDSDGIRVYRSDGDVVITAADIYTTGVNSQGIAVVSDGYTEDVEITASGRIATGQSVAATTNSYAHGIEVLDANGHVIVTLESTGSIETYGARARGIYINGTGDGSGDDYVTVTVEGAITTNAANSHGIDVRYTTGDVTVDHSGTIITEENNSAGIQISDTAGNVVIDSSGDIYTNGIRSYGIQVGGTTGLAENVDITASGRVVTGQSSKYSPSTNSFARGIEVTYANGQVNVALESSGSIETYGARASGIFIDNTGDYVNVTANGSITTNGDSSHGIYVDDTTGNVTVSGAGEITTYGAASHGIYIDDTTGNVTVDHSGTINTQGADSDGIWVGYAAGDVLITTGNIYTDGDYSQGIHVYSPDDIAGNIDITISGRIATGGSYLSSGVEVVDADGHVNVTLDSLGTIETYGAASHGIYILVIGDGSGDDDVNVTADGSITTNGFNSSGIFIWNIAGDVAVSATDIAASGDYSRGIYIGDATGDVTVNHAGIIDASGSYNSGGIRIYDAGGNVTVNAANIYTSGDFSAGIYVLHSTAFTDAVDVTVSGNIVTGRDFQLLPSADNYSHGVYVNSTDEHVKVTLAGTGSIETYGALAHGIYILNTGDGSGADYVTVTANGGITTNGDSSHGIYIGYTTGNVTVSATDITTLGTDSRGIHIGDTTGNVTVSATDITTDSATSHGVVVSSTTGDVTVSQSGTIHTQGYGSIGIGIVNTGGDVDIDASNIYTDGAFAKGIYVGNATVDGGNVDITVSGRIATGRDYQSLPSTNTFSHGIYVDNIDGHVKVALGSLGEIETYGANASGLYITDTGGYVQIVSDGAIATHGFYSYGIFIDQTAGDVTVSALDIVTYGDRGSDAIRIERTVGNVSLSAAAITTYGEYSRGIFIDETTGGVDVTASAAIVTGKNYAGDPATTISYASGIHVENSSGTVSITLSAAGSIETYGADAPGIYIADTGDGSGADYVTVTANGSITTHGDDSNGIRILDTIGSVTVSAAGITTYGDDSHGIYIEDTTGSVTVTASGAIVTAKNYSGDPSTDSFANGIYVAETSGSVAVTLSAAGSIETYGAHADGIFVLGTGDGSGADNVTITAAGGITTHGDESSGILVLDTTGPVTVSAAGIATSGASSHGIYVGGGATGTVTVNASGPIDLSGADADGVYVKDALGVVAVNITGDVLGGSDDGAGVRLDNPNASSSTLTISSDGKLGALSDLAIDADDDDDLVIDNSGEITGIVNLGADAVFNNEAGATWYLRYGNAAANADFGGTADNDIFNNSGTLSLSKGTQAVWEGALLDLETFNHSGSIILADGVVGDTLSISGEFVSNGGSLYIDTVLDDGTSDPQSDVLYLKTVSSLQPTLVRIENAGGAGGNTSGDGILIIEADEDESGGAAFELAEAVVISGVDQFDYELIYDASAIAWYLQTAQQTFEGTVEYPVLVAGALMGWYADLGHLHDRMHNPAPGETPSIEPAAWTGHRIGTWLTALGARQSVDNGVAYDQAIARIEGGVDARLDDSRFGQMIFGMFGGYGQNEQDFEASTSQAGTDLLLAGAYASYSFGPMYTEAVGKYEHHWANFSGAATSEEEAPYTVDVFGGSLETGLRFAWTGFAVAPRARLSYARVKAGSFEDMSGETVDLLDGESLRGELALRLESTLWNGASPGTASLDAGVRHEIIGETEAEVSGQTFTHELPGTTGFFATTLDVALFEELLSLGLRTEYARGEDSEEYGAGITLDVRM